MRITKQFETIINLSAIEQFSDIDKTIFDKLVSLEGKCDKNSLIIKIKQIKKRSDVMMVKSKLDGSGDVCVQFLADAIVYNENDILVGCRVQGIERGQRIILKYLDNVIVNVKADEKLLGLQDSQILTIRVVNTTYPKGKNMIVVSGILFMNNSGRINIYEPISFHDEIVDKSIIDDSSKREEQINLLKYKLYEVEQELEQHKNLDKKLMEFFKNLYYPFNKQVDVKLKKISIIDLAKKILTKSNVAIHIFQHPTLQMYDPDVYTIDKVTELPAEFQDKNIYQNLFIKEDIFLIIFKMLNDYLNYIRMIRESCETYNTEEIFRNHINIWNIYKKIKK
jgi:hypothetical protein